IQASKETLLSDLALARRLREAVTGRVEQLEGIDAEFEVYTADWLADLPYSLAEQGMVDEATALCASWAEVLWPDEFLGDRAMILARAGRHEEALAQVQALRERYPEEL